MRDFDFIVSPEKLLTPEIVQMVSSIHEHKGKQELFLEAKSEAFTELMRLYMTDMYKVAYAILMNDEDAADAIRDGVVITCTANYKDGTKKGAKINVGAAALTYEEIGMNVDGMTLQIEGEDEH